MAGSRLNTGFLGLPKNFFKKYLHFGSGQYIIHGVERQRCKTTAEEISEIKNLPVRFFLTGKVPMKPRQGRSISKPVKRSRSRATNLDKKNIVSEKMEHVARWQRSFTKSFQGGYTI